MPGAARVGLITGEAPWQKGLASYYKTYHSPARAGWVWVLAENRQLIEAVWRASANISEAQPVLAQFVVQGFAWHAKGFCQAA